jgi:hypothetical protein
MSEPSSRPAQTVLHYCTPEKVGATCFVYRGDHSRRHPFLALRPLPVEFAKDRQVLLPFPREAHSSSVLINRDQDERVTVFHCQAVGILKKH